MLAGKINAPGQATISTVELPEPVQDDMLIEVHAAGICGTDLHIFEGEYEAQYPLIPGHEFSGGGPVVAGWRRHTGRHRAGPS